MKLVVVIPNYNHGNTILSVLKRLEKYALPCIIVDDGSGQDTKQQLQAAQQKFAWVELVTLPNNLGKGAAMLHGFIQAEKKGYTHVLQIDADGQHAIEDVQKFIEAGELYPKAMISGQPIYDESIPKSRLYGRKITNFWVLIETWSLSIPEAMCGFRIYPLKETLSIMRNSYVGKRMDFDTEILVKLYWEGINLHFIPTKVIYLENGISHFKLYRDNFRISWMHTRLFFNMLLKIPKIIKRKHLC